MLFFITDVFIDGLILDLAMQYLGRVIVFQSISVLIFISGFVS